MNDFGPRLTSLNEKPPTPASGDPARSVGSMVLAVSSIGLCLLVVLAALLSRHWTSRTIEDFGVDMSAVTRFAIGPWFPTLLAIVILTAVGMQFVLRRQSARDIGNLMVLIVGVTSLAVYILGVLAPLVSLVNALS